MTDDPRDPGFERLLQYLLEARGFDFTGYKRNSLQRRVSKRMSQVGISDYAEYSSTSRITATNSRRCSTRS